MKRALVSVSDKTGLVEFMRPLVAKGLKIISTGGTAKHLRENGFEVDDISEQTQFPEVMDGRVKTLHPRVHMCLLARDHVDADMELLKSQELEPFDLVVGNLYPFEKALLNKIEDLDLVEKIDIGGPSFLRAAAKNFFRITTLVDPADYSWVLERGSELNLEDRKSLAAKVFSHVGSYDAMVARGLGVRLSSSENALGGNFISELRYGENPTQKAVWFHQKGASEGLQNAEILQGKPLSYNNILDLHAACSTLLDLQAFPAAIAVKHNNPCGVGTDSNISLALEKALKADPMSVFGGIIALNAQVGAAEAKQLSPVFLECVVAPDFSDEALQLLAKKKNLRLLKWQGLDRANSVVKEIGDWSYRSVLGGYLVQTIDRVNVDWNEDWTIIGDAPNESQKADLLLAWKTCAHLKSNAISLVAQGQSLGLGMGQVNRVDAVKQALDRRDEFHGSSKGAVLASDAFFPFPDSIELLAKRGVKWVIQPGGSVKDKEVIQRAKELGVNMIMTGQRHFLH